MINKEKIKMPSIKKRVTGFIRQISGPSQTPSRAAPVSPPPQYEKCFIQRYLSGETRPKQTPISHAKTGHGLPVHDLGGLQPEVFAAYTGPEGGLTCISRDIDGEEDRESAVEVDYIDIEGAVRSRPVSRRASVALDAFEKESARPHIRSDPNAIRVPKSPVYIDNSVMTIRVMDRVYRVDDSTSRYSARGSVSSQTSHASRDSWRSANQSRDNMRSAGQPQSLPYVSSDDLSRPAVSSSQRRADVKGLPLSASRSPAHGLSSGGRTPFSCPQSSTGTPAHQYSRALQECHLTPMSKTSDIIDIDDALDLVETEDGYLPMKSLDASELSSNRKVISLSSPAKPPVRPSFLDINSENQQSYSSLPVNSHRLTDENLEKTKEKQFDKSSRISFVQEKSPNGTSGKLDTEKAGNGDQSNNRNGRSEYPELKQNCESKKNKTAAAAGHEMSPAAPKTESSEESVLKRLKIDLKDDISRSIAGVRHWNRPNGAAYGVSVSLYERNPITSEQAGSPMADTFAVVARKNSAILVLGDGVNWGGKAALASRSAVHGAMDYLNTALFGVNRTRKLTTQDVFQILLRSFHAAHCLIIEQDGMLTTLTAAVVLPTAENKFHFCVCNVGDSLAYVYSKGNVREVTEGSHDITANRDMRDALGALGPVDGLNPELSNLTCSITEVFPGDIVFLTSDGISDNFDPVVGKFCVPRKPERAMSQKLTGSNFRNRSKSAASDLNDTLPTVEGYQRHELTLLRIEDILNHDWGSNAALNRNGGRVEDASELCHRMLDFCQRLTTAKRKILEDPELYSDKEKDMQSDQKMRRRKVCEKLALVPGKLDHATLTAYQVGDRTEELQHYTGDKTDVVGRHTPGLTHAAPHASLEDLTMRESPPDSGDDITPTASISLDSTPLASGASSLAHTPTHTPLNSGMSNQ